LIVVHKQGMLIASVRQAAQTWEKRVSGVQSAKIMTRISSDKLKTPAAGQLSSASETCWT
jgi:hypothetical protein